MFGEIEKTANRIRQTSGDPTLPIETKQLLRGGVLGGLLGLLGVLVLLGLLGGRHHRRLPLLRRLWRPGSAVESTLRVGHSIFNS